MDSEKPPGYPDIPEAQPKGRYDGVNEICFYGYR